jgi:adenylate cyclase
MFRRGRVQESIPLFEKAASLMQSDWHNPMMLTTCYQSVGDQESLLRCARLAVERAEMAVAKDPTNAQALAGGSTALALIGEERRARDWIERALLVDPDNIIMRYNLACALSARLQDYGRAIEVMEPYFERASATLIRHLGADPDMDGIREDPRFIDMLSAAKQRLGIAAASA